MIKVALVLYAKSFKVIGDVGLQGLLVAWIGSPLAVVAGWFIGVHALKPAPGEAAMNVERGC